MTPRPKLALASMIKAMREVVLPALPADASFADEQGRMVLNNLRLLLEQWDEIGPLTALLDDARRLLASRLAQAASGGPETTAAATALADAMSGGDSDAIAGATDALLRASEADGDEASQSSIERLVLEHAAAEAKAGRIWFAGAGMDADAPASTSPGDAAQVMRAYIKAVAPAGMRHKLIALTNAAEGRQADYEAWYHRQHIPDLLRVPGVVAAQVHRASLPGEHHFLTIYDLITPDPAAVMAEIRALSGTPLLPAWEARGPGGTMGVFTVSTARSGTDESDTDTA